MRVIDLQGTTTNIPDSHHGAAGWRPDAGRSPLEGHVKDHGSQEISPTTNEGWEPPPGEKKIGPIRGCTSLKKSQV